MVCDGGKAGMRGKTGVGIRGKTGIEIKGKTGVGREIEFFGFGTVLKIAVGG